MNNLTNGISGSLNLQNASEDHSALFKEGYFVMHPVYGIGLVETIEDKALNGRTNRFATVSFQNDKLRIMVNLDLKDSLIRRLINKDDIPSVISYLKEYQSDIPVKSSDRYNVNMKKIKSSDITKLVQVIKDLVVLSKSKKLTPKEQNMLKQSKKI